mgnify:CR=1 FL=1
MTSKHPGYTYRQFCEKLVSSAGKGNVRPFSDFSFKKTEGFPFDIDQTQTEGKKNIIMRHDVDHDPEVARNLARVEKETGVRSTFFALTADTSRRWWINEEARKKMIEWYQEIQDMGHEVGLHYDFLGEYFSLGKDPKESSEEILSVFRSNGLKISGCASHGSSTMRGFVGSNFGQPYPKDYINYRVWREVNKDGARLESNSKTLNTPCMSLRSQGLMYESYFVRKDWYLSDSGGNFWTGGPSLKTDGKHLSSTKNDPCVTASDCMKKGEIMQILVHPIWWKANLG